MRPNQAQHLNHLARAAGLAVPMNQLLKQPIITLRPQSPLAPRGEWLRADQRTWLAFQHVEIMFEIEHLLAAFVAALVAGDYSGPHRGSRRGSDKAAPRPSCRAAPAPNRDWSAPARNPSHRRAENTTSTSSKSCSASGSKCARSAIIAAPTARVVAGDLTPFIFVTGGQQLGVEIIKIPRVRQRHPVIAPEVTGFALNPAFFVRFPRIAKVAREAPVRAEGDEARGLLAPMAAQNLLHRTLQVVVSEQPEDSAKIMKRLLVGLEKRLLRRALIRPMKGRAAHHAAQREHLQLDRLAAQLRPRLVPIDLAFLPRRVALRHAGLARRPAQFAVCVRARTRRTVDLRHPVVW